MHSGTLLGSSPVRSRTAVNDDRSCMKRLLVTRRPFLFHDMSDFTQCQEKSTDEPLAVLLRHSAVVVAVLFERGESPFDCVVGVRLPAIFGQLVREEVRRVESNAVHGYSCKLEDIFLQFDRWTSSYDLAQRLLLHQPAVGRLTA